MGTLRKMKRGIEAKKPLPLLNIKLVEELAFNKGYNEGAADQRKADIENLVGMLETLEQLPGIGDKTAEKIRLMVLERFEQKEG